MTNMLFGDWLKRERRARKLTQEDLEGLASLGDKYVSKVERKELVLPGEDVRKRIHAALGTSDDDLVQAGILEVVQATGFDPVYVPVSSHENARRAVAETEARYDEIDARMRLRIRAEKLTSEQAEAILGMLDVFAPEP